MKKIAIFADVQNIYYTTRQAYGKQFNYRKLWQQISAQGEIICAYAYAIERGDNQQQKFQEMLRHVGFDVRLKPFIQRSDGTAKGDWDVGITIDVMESAAEVDTVILLTGDGDFAILLDKVNSKFGVTTEAYGVPKLSAKALIDACTQFHPIDSDLLMG
ncbi:NYN domain-containing protein [Psychromonas sp. GE-S-Ul-11]|uniref:LabA-like NYN domain-containing protein n=1 Tax=Psychromonas sp. GE-S-Ul-11 TaxID=3241170 RepID=UPI00390C93C7